MPALSCLELNAAGVDVGATEIYIAVPADRDPQPVCRFSTFTEDLHAALRANISETVLVLLINEQGEKEKGRDERQFSWFCFFWRLGCHGTKASLASRSGYVEHE